MSFKFNFNTSEDNVESTKRDNDVSNVTDSDIDRDGDNADKTKLKRSKKMLHTESNDEEVHEKKNRKEEMDPQPLPPAEEVQLPNDLEGLYESLTVGGSLDVEGEEEHFLHYVDANEAEKRIRESGSNLVKALDNQSDLIPFVYEGGLKTWECSKDLVSYLSSLDIAFRGTKVIELGCGSALPGLYALTKGASVHFQDYNKEVILLITIPNVLLNTEIEDVPKNARFYAGDWSSLTELIMEESTADINHIDKYDLILTSETIYNPLSQQKLLSLMSSLLKRDGVIYLAAKIHYFGVGGGTRQFQELVDRDGTFHCEVVKTFEEGVNRDILKLKFKD